MTSDEKNMCRKTKIMSKYKVMKKYIKDKKKYIMFIFVV